MTKEEKQLLLKDLCGRLPYRVCVHFSNTNIDETLTSVDINEKDINKTRHNGKGNQCKVIPYLRSMSSMTEEEREYLKHHVNDDFVDYCNKHHFDYRGLIPMGLALEAPEGMYKMD